MGTLRGRLPVLLSECIGRGITVKFGFHLDEPFIEWAYPNGNGSHVHLTSFVPEVHGANMLEIEKVLEVILSNTQVVSKSEMRRRIAFSRKD